MCIYPVYEAWLGSALDSRDYIFYGFVGRNIHQNHLIYEINHGIVIFAYTYVD